MKNFCHTFFFIYRRGTIHVLWAMVQRSGHSTCGYHGWSLWRTCCLFCSCGKGLSREPQQQNFSFTQLSQPEIFFGVVFHLFAWYFYSHGPRPPREPYSDYFQFLGLIWRRLWSRLCFRSTSHYSFFLLQLLFSSQFCTWGGPVPDGSIIHPFLSSVCVWICIETGRSLMTSPFLVPLKNVFHIQ